MNIYDAGLNYYHCECPTGYNGLNCEKDIDECDVLKPCKNSAHCKESNTYNFLAAGEFECECVEYFGFTGEICDECGPGSGVSDEGRCTECEHPQWNNATTKSAVCADQTCDDGFGVSSDAWNVLGGNCEECPVGSFSEMGSGMCSNINECENLPCQNSGVCTETSDGTTLTPGVYHCQCLDGYTGTNCEEDINECDPDPCQNSGVCSEGVGEYTCECLAGFTGSKCEIDTNECDPDPCQNSAACIESGTPKMSSFENYVEDLD